MTELIRALKEERARIIDLLPGLDPTTGGYLNALRSLAELNWRLEDFEAKNAGVGACTPAPAAHTPAPVEPVPAATSVPAQEAVSEPGVDFDARKAALKDRLTDARLEKGIDTKALLAKVGVAKYSLIQDMETLMALEKAFEDEMKGGA